MLCTTLYHLYSLKKKHEKYPWRSVTFGKIAGFCLKTTKSNTLPWVFSVFLIVQMVPNCTIYLAYFNKYFALCSKLAKDPEP